MLAIDKMKFGENTDINYKAPIIIPSNATQMNRVGDATPKPKTKTQGSEASIVTPKTTERSDANVSVSKPKAPIASVASEILGITMMVGGFLFSKYIL